jgi:hypothetical protein
MWYNPIMAALLRSPLHGMLSNNTMLITVKGRLSGREYTTPVSYSRQGEELWVISKRERTWWRNLRGGAPASLLMRGQQVPAYGEAVTDESQVASMLGEFLGHNPNLAKPLGVSMPDGRADPQDLAESAKVRVFVRLRLA